MSNERTGYTPEQVAEMLVVSLRFVYSKLKDESIPAVHLGDRWLIPISSYNKWLENAGYQAPSKKIGPDEEG